MPLGRLRSCLPDQMLRRRLTSSLLPRARSCFLPRAFPQFFPRALACALPRAQNPPVRAHLKYSISKRPQFQVLAYSTPNPSEISGNMNQRGRNLSSNSNQGTGAPAAHAAGSASVAAHAAGSGSVAGAPAVMAASTSPPLASVQAAGFPAWWTSSSPLPSVRHASSTMEGMYPTGGFTNFLQSNCSPENFHLVGNTASRTRTSPTTPSFNGTPPSESNAQDKETINVDADETNEDGRTEKRLNWTKDEDKRLASAWVHNSKDPVDGTDRKSDQYWADVTEEYNKTTEVSRRRNRNQLKIRWDRVKKPVTEFHGCWIKTNKVYRSGMSDDQVMEIAEKMYAKDHNDKDFMLKHIWKVVRDERKWSAYVKRMEQEKEKNKGATKNAAEVINLGDNPNIRPIGHKRAKDERYGKKKTPEAYSAISDKLDKFIEVSTMARKDRENMSEKQ